MKSGSLLLLEPSGPAQACNGIALPFYQQMHLIQNTTSSLNTTHTLHALRGPDPFGSHKVEADVRICTAQRAQTTTDLYTGGPPYPRVIRSKTERYTGCPRRNVPDFGRVFLMLKYTDITQNTYVQSWTVKEITASEVWNFDSCYTLIDYQIHIKTGKNMWFL